MNLRAYIAALDLNPLYPFRNFAWLVPVIVALVALIPGAGGLLAGALLVMWLLAVIEESWKGKDIPPSLPGALGVESKTLSLSDPLWIEYFSFVTVALVCFGAGLLANHFIPEGEYRHPVALGLTIMGAIYYPFAVFQWQSRGNPFKIFNARDLFILLRRFTVHYAILLLCFYSVLFCAYSVLPFANELPTLLRYAIGWALSFWALTLSFHMLGKFIYWIHINLD